MHASSRQTLDTLERLRTGLEPSVRKLRLEFLANIDNPDAAMAIGTLLVTQLEMQQGWAAEAKEHAYDSARAAARMTKPAWRADNEFWGELDALDELSAAADEQASE